MEFASLVPASLKGQTLTLAQRRYLLQVVQEADQLAQSILRVQRRQKAWSKDMLVSSPEDCCYLISLIQLAQNEYELLFVQWQALVASVEATVASWQNLDAKISWA